ncbi:MAG: helix-turn-helix transcriptional regulator [Deltaproteobacteria bacterium]|nr:helix-turn-helix transcriptional regulator [Deltaproteobacteria bacterium]
MPRTTKTGFGKFFDAQMAQPSFAKDCKQARAEVDAIDQIVRALDGAREQLGLTKADLARAISAKPEIVRRLFTAEDPTPTLSTVVKVAIALGYRLELVRGIHGPCARHRGAVHRRSRPWTRWRPTCRRR